MSAVGPGTRLLSLLVRTIGVVMTLACVQSIGFVEICADAGAAGFRIQPRIFNGVVTFDHPFVGALLHRNTPRDDWASQCTVTLIGPASVLTAAHCVCPSHGSLCGPGARDEPPTDEYRVLLQNAGILEIASIVIPSGFSFPNDDYALLNLAHPVVGIPPVDFAEDIPPFGSPGEIVGFGGVSDLAQNQGIKRSGTIHTTSCDGNLREDLFVCWETGPPTQDANTCPGDSGAPLLIENENGDLVLAGIASGGYGRCDSDDLAFDTAIAPFLSEIRAISQEHAETSNESVAQARVKEGTFDASAESETLSINVPAEASRILAVGNADDRAGNDYGLRLRRGSVPTESGFDCVSDRQGVFETCTVQEPVAGTWYATYAKESGRGGAFQLSLTVLSGVCSLDIDRNGLFDALTDGLLALRHISGFQGEHLAFQALGPSSLRDTPEKVTAFLETNACIRDLDVDGNGTRHRDSDGALIVRYLFGFRGAALIDSAIGDNAIRATSEQIERWLDRLAK